MNKFTTIRFDEFVKRVQDHLHRPSQQSGAAYTLLLGAGMSFPLVPTATQMTLRDIPWWLMWKQDNPTEPFPDTPQHDEKLDAFAREMWSEVYRQTGDFELSEDDGLPVCKADNIGKAYQTVMSGRTHSGLSSREQQRWYLRDVVHRIGRRMNMAHLTLASILREQNRQEYRDRYSRPFCNTIFTTNFDNLLQRSLQMVNQLYYMTDRPELGLAPLDDSVESAVHLIYTHGNTYRYYLANTQSDIRALADENARDLTYYFERHGVIAMGYSGWLDTTMTVLKDCSGFDGNLYWCDMHTPSQAETGGLRKDVVKLLAEDREHRFYVQLPSGGADQGMLALHKGLVLEQWPTVLFNPLCGLIEMLEGIQMPKSFDSAHTKRYIENDKWEFAYRSIGEFDQPQDVLERTLIWLRWAKEQGFEETITTTTQEPSHIEDAEIARLMNLAQRAALNSETEEAIDYLDRLLEIEELTEEQKATALLNRGIVKDQAGENNKAVEDYNAVLELENLPDNLEMSALLGRGVANAYGDNIERAIGDFTVVLENHTATTDQKATALFNRGLAKSQKKDIDDAIKDYSAVLMISEASTEHKANALFNRGVLKGMRENLKDAISDYNILLKVPGVSTRHKIEALTNRGVAKSELGDTRGAIDDYTAVIESTEASPHHIAHALFNRGFAKKLTGDTKEAIADYTALIEMQLNNPGNAVEALEKWRELDPEAKRTKLDGDSDFDGIRKHPAFVAFREKLPPG